jgi:hypothetical protein
MRSNISSWCVALLRSGNVLTSPRAGCVDLVCTVLDARLFADQAFRFLDAVHTVLICTGVWDYLILHFTDPNIVETIFPFVL